jgi:peptidoglycan hydrolase-like protein with peptidoglycan-binding domain
LSFRDARRWRGALLRACGRAARQSPQGPRLSCRFGTATKNATKKWQKAHGLTADGKVGPKTFGKADNKLYSNSGNVFYNGTKRDTVFRRSGGKYYVYDKGWKLASYTKATLSRCR